MTFEDWTDVMYEIMAEPGYSWAWVYFLSFIFLTAFAFLNMVIGIVVNVFDEEKEKERMKTQKPDSTKVSNEQLAKKIEELTLLVSSQQALLLQTQKESQKEIV